MFCRFDDDSKQKHADEGSTGTTVSFGATHSFNSHTVPEGSVANSEAAFGNEVHQAKKTVAH